MTELGATSDPRALIPGSPETIEQNALALNGYAQRADQVGHRLRRLDLAGWNGPAAEAFGQGWAEETAKWGRAADAITSIATGLTSYAGTLRWAQGQAGMAVTRWNQANVMSAEALTRYRAAAATGVPMAPFVDPGEQRREDARAILIAARSQLAEAGDTIARQINGHAVGAPGTGVRAGGGVNALVDAVTGGWVVHGSDTKQGPGAGASVASVQSGKLDELKAYAQLGADTWAGSARHGDFSATGTAGFTIGAQASAGASLSAEHGLSAKAEASAQARASAEGHVDYGPAGLYGRLSGSAGASAGAGVTFGKSGVLANAGAFGGIRGGGAVGVEGGGIAIGASAEGWVGPGAEAKIGWSEQDDGKWHFRAKAGISPAVGGSVGVELTVDPKEVERTARAAADAVGRTAREVEGMGTGLSDQVGEAAGHLGDGVGHAVGNAGSYLSRVLG